MSKIIGKILLSIIPTIMASAGFFAFPGAFFGTNPKITINDVTLSPSFFFYAGIALMILGTATDTAIWASVRPVFHYGISLMWGWMFIYSWIPIYFAWTHTQTSVANIYILFIVGIPLALISLAATSISRFY